MVFLFLGISFLLFYNFYFIERKIYNENRWLIALSAIGIHICIGSVYAWSVLTKPIMAQMGFSLQETTWTFSIAILF
mgnify:CR=1 FL=1